MSICGVCYVADIIEWYNAESTDWYRAGNYEVL